MSNLPRRNMGRTGMQPRALGMGAAFVGASGEAETIATIERALDLGIDYFDSYAGRNEDRWGKALAGVERSSYYMQAKVGPHPERPKDFSAEVTRWSVEQSLQFASRRLPRRRVSPRPARYCRPVRPWSRL